MEIDSQDRGSRQRQLVPSAICALRIMILKTITSPIVALVSTDWPNGVQTGNDEKVGQKEVTKNNSSPARHIGSYNQPIGRMVKYVNKTFVYARRIPPFRDSAFGDSLGQQ